MNSNTRFILISKQDKNIFLKGMIHPPQPGSRLVEAAKRYRKLYDQESKIEPVENKSDSGDGTNS